MRRENPKPAFTRIVAEGGVVDADTGEVFKWHPEPMVLPVSDKLAQRVEEEDGAAKRYRLKFRSGR